MSMQGSIDKFQASARKIFGADIAVRVARCPSWGHSDCCILINGRQHAYVAAAFAKATAGTKITSETTPAWMGMPASTYSVVEFPAAKEIPA